MRYAIFVFAVALVVASTASPVLACNGHGSAVAAAINDFFSGQGNANASGDGMAEGADSVSVNNGDVNGNSVSGGFGGGYSNVDNAASVMVQVVNAFLGTNNAINKKTHNINLDYNG